MTEYYAQAQQCESWLDYWRRSDFFSKSRLWEINARTGFERACEVVDISKNNSVLNIGCGPGYLEPYLAPLVKSIHAVDIAEDSVAQCKKRCENLDNVTVSILGDHYTDLNIFGRSFSLFLCFSVVQYYKNIGELESLIASARRIALPGARMLIADLPLKRGPIGFAWDIMCSCLTGLRKGYLLLMLKTIQSSYAERSAYQLFSKKVSQLYFTFEDIDSLIKRLNLNAVIIRKSLSIYENRPSLLIKF